MAFENSSKLNGGRASYWRIIAWEFYPASKTIEVIFAGHSRRKTRQAGYAPVGHRSLHIDKAEYGTMDPTKMSIGDLYALVRKLADADEKDWLHGARDC